jgi:hypothetical protein
LNRVQYLAGFGIKGSEGPSCNWAATKPGGRARFGGAQKSRPPVCFYR